MIQRTPLSIISSFSLYTQQYIQVYCVYSKKKLLMMDRGTVRNM